MSISLRKKKRFFSCDLPRSIPTELSAMQKIISLPNFDPNLTVVLKILTKLYENI